MPTMRVPIDLTWTTASGSPGVNVFHARTTSGDASNFELEELTEALEAFYTQITECFPGAVTIRWGGEASGVGDDEGNTYTSPSWTVNGSGGIGWLPPANALIVNWRANTGGRRGRGRTFIGPLVGATNEQNGTPDETIRAELQGAATTLISASEGVLNGALGVYSRVDNVFRDFASADVPNKFAVLRSRRD